MRVAFRLLGEPAFGNIFSVRTDVEIPEGFHATDLHCESSLFESCKAHSETLFELSSIDCAKTCLTEIVVITGD